MGTRQKSKKRTFEIPKDFIGTFFSQLESSDLQYSLESVDEENEELIIVVEYSESERDEVMNLIELLDEYFEEGETEEEETEEDK